MHLQWGSPERCPSKTEKESWKKKCWLLVCLSFLCFVIVVFGWVVCLFVGIFYFFFILIPGNEKGSSPFTSS